MPSLKVFVLPIGLDKLTFLCPRHAPLNPFREGNPCQDETSPFLDSGNGTGSPGKGKECHRIGALVLEEIEPKQKPAETRKSPLASFYA